MLITTVLGVLLLVYLDMSSARLFTGLAACDLAVLQNVCSDDSVLMMDLCNVTKARQDH